MRQQKLAVKNIEELFQENESRPELWVPAIDDGKTRVGVVHATPPVDADYAHKLTETTGSEVAEALTALREKFDTPIEWVTYPRPVTDPDADMEAVLCHAFHIERHFVDGRALQSDLGEFSEKIVANRIEDAYETVEATFPDTYTVEVGNLDLDPISVGGPASTCRLMNEDSTEVSGVGKIDAVPMESVFDALVQACEPFVHQLIVEPGDGKCFITSRLAPLSPEYTYEGDRGLARIVREGAHADLARPFGSVGLTSNFSIDIEDYLLITLEQRVSGNTTYSVSIRDSMRKRYDTKYQHERKVDDLKEAILGHEEFRRLLRGTTGTKERIEDHGYYGRFWIPPSSIAYFTRRYAHTYDEDPWENTPRNNPVFTPKDIHGIKVRTDWDTSTSDINATTRHQTDGSDEHLQLGDRFREFARSRGDEITRVEQDGDSLPDERLTADDGYVHVLESHVDSDIVNVEPEWENSSKPANVLTNVERALAMDRHVILVFSCERLAKRGYKALYSTFRDATEYGVRTYQDDPIPRIDGEMLVTPEAESTWYVSPDDMLVHVIDDEVVTRCPADADLTTVDHGCATARKEDGTYTVTTRDGGTLTYDNDAAFNRDWTRVMMPHVPVDISYLHSVSIMYETGSKKEQTGTFREYEPTPEWERASGKQDRYNQFGATVAEEFLVEKSGAELAVNECHTTMMNVYQWCTDKDAPNTGWFGKGLPDHINRKDGDQGQKILVDHTWVFSRGVVSPHLAGVDAEADLPP